MRNYPKRRKIRDPLRITLTLANAIAAIGLFISLCILAAAKPESATFFDHYFNVNVYRRPHWDMALIDTIAIMLLVSGLASIVGLWANSRRLKRKGDYIHSTLVLCLMLSCAGFGLYLWYR